MKTRHEEIKEILYDFLLDCKHAKKKDEIQKSINARTAELYGLFSELITIDVPAIRPENKKIKTFESGEDFCNWLANVCKEHRETNNGSTLERLFGGNKHEYSCSGCENDGLCQQVRAFIVANYGLENNINFKLDERTASVMPYVKQPGVVKAILNEFVKYMKSK